MKVVEMLQRGAIVAPLDAPDLKWALTSTLRALATVSEAEAARLATELVEGISGEIHHVHERVVLALTESDAVAELCAVIGVSPMGFGPDETEAASQALLVLVTPDRFLAVRDRMLPALKRFFRETEKVAPLLNARSAGDVQRVSGLMDLELHQSLLVQDVVEPVQYRVYPDTPYSEVADLMVRRGLQSVPVVGEDYEFLGVITTGDALEEVVSHARVEESAGGGSATPGTEPTAREIMTRTVMCVSEDQSLLEAASIMVNRDVEQLPVIRAGEVVGLLTRGEVLRWLFPETSSKPKEET